MPRMLASQVSELRQFHRMNSEIWRFCPRIVERLRLEAATYMETNHREVLNEGFVVSGSKINANARTCQGCNSPLSEKNISRSVRVIV